MLHWGRTRKSYLHGEAWGEAGQEAPRARVFACVCVYMHIFQLWQIPLDKRLRVCVCVCVRAHIPTMADATLLFQLCHPPHQNTRLSVTEASWPVQRHGCFEESPLPPRRRVSRPQRGEG